MEQIARIVGHSKVDTTDGYLHVSDETLERAVQVLNRRKGK
jgi:site-specific recombinase XerD